jgi:DNA repair exonuclease SbcCD ATPase subunit
MCDKTRHLDGRLAFLKAELKITSEQEQVWNDYASAVRANADSLKERCKEIKEIKEEDKRPPLPERLDLRTKMMEARLALRTKAKSLKPLYDALSDEQKATVDELIRL